MDSDELTQLIKLKLASVQPEIEICLGSIFNLQTNASVEYRVTCGWNVLTAHECDISWNAFRLEVAHFLEQLTPEERAIETSKIANEDAHWKWFDKSLLLKGTEYTWFFFRIHDEVQAACLIYHPKKAILSDTQLFYIEFIAVAPWNRYNPLYINKFKGVGTIFLKEIMCYCTDVLQYEPGMCLHSLPQAQTFYEKKLKMIHCDTADKDGLWYYEMREKNFIEFVRA